MPRIGERLHFLEYGFFPRLVCHRAAAEIYAYAETHAIHDADRARHSARRAIEVHVQVDDAVLAPPRIRRFGGAGEQGEESQGEKLHASRLRRARRASSPILPSRVYVRSRFQNSCRRFPGLERIECEFKEYATNESGDPTPG